MTRLKRISVLQTSKVAAIMYFIGSAVIFIPFGLIVSGIQGSVQNAPVGNAFMGSMAFMFIAPFIYAVVGFIGTAIMCWLYNVTVKFTGGIQFQLESTDGASEEEENTLDAGV